MPASLGGQSVTLPDPISSSSTGRRASWVTNTSMLLRHMAVATQQTRLRMQVLAGFNALDVLLQCSVRSGTAPTPPTGVTSTPESGNILADLDAYLPRVKALIAQTPISDLTVDPRSRWRSRPASSRR